MYIAFRIACFVLFWLSVPILLVVRRRTRAPWWRIVATATVSGWVLINANVFLERAALEESIRQASIICNASSPVVTEKNGLYEASLDNYCGGGVWFVDGYKPFSGLIYGPLYLLCCLIPYLLIVVRGVSSAKRQIIWLAPAAFVVEWTAIAGACIRPGGAAISCLRYADPYIEPPLTITAAIVIAWLIATRLLQRFDTRPR